MKDLTVTRPFSEEDYNELLQQAVAVIETSRLRIAKQLNTVAMPSYWAIGKCKFGIIDSVELSPSW